MASCHGRIERRDQSGSFSMMDSNKLTEKGEFKAQQSRADLESSRPLTPFNNDTTNDDHPIDHMGPFVRA